MISDSQQNIVVKKLKQHARKSIINSSFREDQNNTLSRWINTFLFSDDFQHSEEHKNACIMMKLILAAIACGDFQVKFFSTDKHFREAPIVFQMTDYISHAGRILIDLSNLSFENKHKVLSIFDLNKMKPRPSTHCIIVSEGKYLEAKSQAHGGIETFKGFVHKAGEATGINLIVQGTRLQGPVLTDFGINIQMGGFGQLNLSKGWSQFGLDGHILLHQTADNNALLIGLEQSSPLIKPIIDIPVEENNSIGLSGLHSMTGASDDYTAAGSLYFSNLIYKLKVFTETKCWCPTKYDGMSIKLNNHNIEAVWNYFNALKDANSKERLLSLLSTKPKNAIDTFFSAKEILKSISDKDIEEFFRQLISAEILSSESKELKKEFKFRINQIREFLNHQEVDFTFLNINNDIYDNEHLVHLNQIINDALNEMHEETLLDIKNMIKQTKPDLYRAKFIIDSFKKYIDITQTNSKLYSHINVSYHNFLVISQELEKYLQIFEKKLSDGFILYSKLIQAKKDLTNQMDSDDSQVIYNTIYEHFRLEEKLILNSLEHHNQLEYFRQENEKLLMKLADFESHILVLKQDLEQQEEYQYINEIFLFRLCSFIFDLNTLGILSAVCCTGLLLAIFLGPWSFANQLTLMTISVGIS